MAHSRLAVLSRLTASVAAGYAFTLAVAAAAALVLQRAWPMPRDEATVIVSLVACALYPVVVMWGFAATRLVRVWAVLAGGAGAAYLLAQALLRMGS